MDDNNKQPQILTPIINSLKVLFGLDDKQIAVLKGQATDAQKYGQTGSSFEERLSKLFVGSIELGQDRLSKYRDYDRMDASSTECGVALDIYGEEASQKDSKTGLRVWIDSPEEEVAQVLNAMIQRIKLENKVYGIYRNLAKYGDVFLYLSLGGYGIHDSQFIHPARVERHQTSTLLGFKCPDLAGLLPTDNKGQLFKPWEFCHFRIMAYDQESTSGRSFLENVRKAWKSFSMLETMLVLYRISKTVQRNVFYVDVGQASIEETHVLVSDYKKYLKTKNYFTDPKTNEFKVDFDPAMFLQDIVWPIRTGSASRVEPLQNNPNIGSLEDYEQLKDKIRTGLNIPKDYFDGVTTGAWNSKEALQLQDVRFSKKIQKLQDSIREGVIRMCQIHWGIIKGEYLDPQRFQVQLGTISEVAERQREDVLLRKAQIVEILSNVAVTLGWNRWAWGDYILDEIFPLPAEVRAKLMTPDPVLGMEFDKEKELAKADGGDRGKIKGGKGIKLAKPNRQVTADSLKFGLRGFGYGEAKADPLDPTKDLTEEFQQEDSREDTPMPTVKPGVLIENTMLGYTEGELLDLITQSAQYRSRTDDNLTKVREVLEGLGPESAEYYLTESEEFFKTNYTNQDILETIKKDTELG